MQQRVQPHAAEAAAACNMRLLPRAVRRLPSTLTGTATVSSQPHSTQSQKAAPTPSASAAWRRERRGGQRAALHLVALGLGLGL